MGVGTKGKKLWTERGGKIQAKEKKKTKGVLGRKKLERCEYLPSRGKIMFPSRKWVERAQVLCEPLLPKLHPPLGLSGGPRCQEQTKLPPSESPGRQSCSH